jgi:hypothetical protein
VPSKKKTRANALSNDLSKSALYRKTPIGFLSRRYYKMEYRINDSKDKYRNKYYKGLYLLPRKKFYEWALEHPTFLKLFNDYKMSGYHLTKTPTIDRINPAVGYKISNMEWVTLSENCRRARVTQKRLK